ncbi:MAG: hypothetical protein OEY49_11000 [Candidatus Heimdallarchaeota archaeon]|nr:hypothetical protein [Candidatus Heimdallarchaeota archaeon]
MSFIDTVSFLLTDTGDTPLPQWVYLSVIFLYGFGTIISLWFLVSLYKQWKLNKDVGDQLKPIILALTGLFLRMFIAVFNSIIILLTDNKLEIYFKSTFQLIPWVIVTWVLNSIITELIQVPQRRQYVIEAVKRRNTIGLWGLFIAFLLSFVGDLGDELAGTVTALIFLIIPFVMFSSSSTLKRESYENASKLVKIRLQMVSLSVLAIAYSLILTPFIIIIAIIGFYNYFVQVTNALVNVSLTLLAIYAFNGTFNTPKWMMRKHGLILEQESLI